MSRVKAQHKCLILDQVTLDPKGDFRDDQVKEWEGSCEPRNVKQERSSSGFS